MNISIHKTMENTASTSKSSINWFKKDSLSGTSKRLSMRTSNGDFYQSSRKILAIFLRHFADTYSTLCSHAICNTKQNAPSWTIRFEILDVYPGEDSQDTAITEIYFDGIDVH